METIQQQPVAAVVTLLKPLGANTKVEFDWTRPESLRQSTSGDMIDFGANLTVVSGAGSSVWHLAHDGPWITAETLAVILRRNQAIQNIRVRP